MNVKIYLVIFLVMTIMSLQAQEKSEELKKAEEYAAILKAKKETVEYELAIAKYKQDINKLSEPDKKTQAESEKAVAELIKATSEANKAAIQAGRELYKGPEVVSPTGKITSSDGAFIESEVLTQVTLNNCMKEFCIVLKAKLTNAKGFVIYNAADIKGLELYAAMKGQMKELENKFSVVERRVSQELKTDLDLTIPPTNTLADPLLIGYAAAGILRTAADVASLFRTNTDYKNFDMSLDENLITSSFSNNSISQSFNWDIYNPSVFPIYTIKLPVGQSSDLIKSLANISRLTALVDAHIITISSRTSKWTTLLAAEKVETNKSRIINYLAEIAKLNSELIIMKDLNNKLTTVLSSPDVTTAFTPLTALLRSERLFMKLSDNEVYTIKFVIISKGSNKITENLWRSAKIYFTAGTELSAVVYDSEGKIVFADNRYSYSDYKTSKDIK
jgi:hypothetical protein